MTRKYKFSKKSTSAALVGVMGVSALSGCSSIHGQVDRAFDQTDNDLRSVGREAQPRINPLVSKVKGAWVADNKPMADVEKVKPLPAVFYTNVTNNTPSAVKVTEVISRISQEKGIQIRLGSDLTINQSRLSEMGMPTGMLADSTSMGGLPPMPKAVGAAAGAAPTSSSVTGGFVVPERINNINYSGTVAGFLDVLASKLQVSWKYENNQVIFYKYETKVWTIKALSGTSSTTNQLKAAVTSSGSSGATGASGGGSDGSGSDNSSQNTTTYQAQIDLWKGLEGTIKNMLSKYGRGNFSASSDLGTITVTDEPERLVAINSFIEKVNKDLSQQVTIQMAVYAVEIDDRDQVSIDWNAVWKNAAVTLGFVTPVTAAAGAGDTLGATVMSGPWAGTTATMQALATVGKATMVTRGQVVTLNRQSAPLQVVDEQSYLASTATTQTGGSTNAVQTTLTPGVVVSGFQATVTPKIEEDGDILLQFGANISNLKSLVTFSSGDGTNKQTIQLPNLEQRSFLQRVKMRSGDTLVLTGFEQSAGLSQNQGMGWSKNILFGGQLYAQGKRVTLVIMVTPFVQR